MQVTDSTEYWTMTFRAKIGVRVLTVAVCGGLWAWFLYEFPGVLLRGGWPIVVPLFLVLFVITFRAMWVAFISLVVLEQDGIVFRRRGRKIKKAYGDLLSVRWDTASPLLTFASGERARISYFIGGLSWDLRQILFEKRPDLFPEDYADPIELPKDLVLQIPKKACVLTIAVSGLMFSGSIVGLLAVPRLWDALWDPWIYIFGVIVMMILFPMYIFYASMQSLRTPKIVFARDDIKIIHRNGPTERISYSEVSSVRESWDEIYITFKNREKMLLTPGMGDLTLAKVFIATANPDADIEGLHILWARISGS